MPTYTYQCTECKKTADMWASINDEAYYVECDNCNIPMRKVLYAVPGYVKGTKNPTKS